MLQLAQQLISARDNQYVHYAKISTTNAITSLFQVNFPFISGNIPASTAYGVYISQPIRYSRACALYSDFLDKAQLLPLKLHTQYYVAPRLRSSLQKFHSRHHDLVDRYELSISQMIMDLLVYT